MTYNKDLQEDKESLFDAVETLQQVLQVFTPMLKGLTFNKKAMKKAVDSDFSNATQVANYLVKRQVPFREAHEIVGKIVKFCQEKDIVLNQLTLIAFKTFHPSFDEEIYKLLDAEAVVEMRCVEGGTAKSSVLNQIMQIEKEQINVRGFITKHKYVLEMLD